jgi:AI2M/AI1M-like HNH endonuclease
MAHDVSKFNTLQWVMSRSLLKTLANKYRTKTTKLLAELKTTVETPAGTTMTCLEMRQERKDKPLLIARFGGIPLRRQPFAVLNDTPYVSKNGRTEILKRLLANECELSGSTDNIEVHHLRKLADLKDKRGRPVPKWKRKMAAMRRKTLVVCRDCHHDIHIGTYDRNNGIRR